MVNYLNTKDTTLAPRASAGEVTKVLWVAQLDDFFSTIFREHLKQRITIITQPTFVFDPFQECSWQK